LPRRAERKAILVAVCDVVLGAVFVGSRRFTALEHVIGAVSALAGIRAWSGYWRARDRYEAWRSRHRR
jgi:hypothetical protein